MATRKKAPARVRAATARDLDEMARMGAELARIHHTYDPLRFMYSATTFVEGYRWWFARELRRRRHACFLVVDRARRRGADGGGIAGYVYGRLEERNWNDLLDAHAALVDVYVLPSERKRGIGIALVRAFCEWARTRGAPRVVLSTASPNKHAQAAFAKAGFRSTMIEMTRESAPAKHRAPKKRAPKKRAAKKRAAKKRATKRRAR